MLCSKIKEISLTSSTKFVSLLPIRKNNIKLWKLNMNSSKNKRSRKVMWSNWSKTTWRWRKRLYLSKNNWVLCKLRLSRRKSSFKKSLKKDRRKLQQGWKWFKDSAMWKSPLTKKMDSVFMTCKELLQKIRFLIYKKLSIGIEKFQNMPLFMAICWPK